ncbi:uncharacterized protein LOC106665824 isoform X4 [Cimex lectularius]|uniref:Uncharacterized protein n=1 Tax=Cimex lectularius TaxID=79782 RepID=A0A8I6RN87_CIMLE|nr:uncharacterized protein LOC106665824 isoform X4 [Cimex lectularius]
MVDLIPQPIWNWVSKAWRSMEDLADKIDDLICTFEGGGDSTMDTVAMYMFGWMLLGLVVVGVGRFAYRKFVTGEKVAVDKTEPAETPAITNKIDAQEPAKEVVLKAVSKPLSAPAVSAGTGKYVPPTPPTRKRLGSKSGRPTGGPVKPKQSTAVHPPPTATGPESESVKWVNDLFNWLYSDLVVVNELLTIWILSLNEFTKKSVAEHGVGVEFVRVLPESPPPNISNVFCECASNDDVTITCDCETTPALQLKVFRQKGEKVEVSHYRLNVNRFRARLNIVAITEKLLADIKCDGWPEVKVSLAQVGSIKNNLDENQLQDVISEIVTAALRSSNVHCNLSQYPNCPRLSRYVASQGPLLPVHYDSLIPGGPNKTSSKRLLIKVIKAQGLGASQGCSEPFCVVEVDDPPQKNQTTSKKGTTNPVWEEHFLFDVNNMTSEILLEVYDKTTDGNKFMGLGIVSMDELTTTPSQRQIISLQSTPVHDSPVSGTLTVEFLMIEGADLPVTGDKPFKVKETLRSVSPSGQMLMTTRTTIVNDQLANGGDGITDSALREIEMNRGLQPNKSTLIIHSVQRSPPSDQQQTLKVELSETGMWHEVSESKQGMNAPSPGGVAENTATNQELNGTDRGRSRKKKRDFFGTLRRRLNRSKARSRSAGPGGDDGDYDQAARSISADRGRDPSAHSTDNNCLIDQQEKELHQSKDTISPLPTIFSYLSVPGLREGSERSSLSEVSGISGASSRTYVNEASTLVLETVENDIYKYYLVPLSIAQRSKWKKKGTKLHIFNDHTFIAKHLSGGTMCQVCKKGLPRRLGKQGYECRDCQLKCHKHCHIKVETTCPNSNIHSLELSLLPVLSE